MKDVYIYCNWKIYLDDEQSESLLRGILSSLQTLTLPDNTPNINLKLFPSTSSLRSLSKIISNCDLPNKKLKLSMGCQNIHYEKTGAFTGETSIMAIQGYCESILVGHSERRNIFAEKNADLNKKIALILENKLEPVICIGEPENLLKNDSEGYLREQILSSVADIDISHQVVFAYEPTGSIGTGVATSPVEVNLKSKLIKKILKQNIPHVDLSLIKILYGGSVNNENITDYLSASDIDGVLVGSSSVDLQKFQMILDKIITLSPT